MRGCTTIGALAALMMFSAAAQSQQLTVVEVNAPAVNCVFETDCKLVVTDTTGNILLPTLAPGTAWLQSRTFIGKAGAPAAGLTGYEYRVSLTQAAGVSDCITGFTVNFGPHTPLPYKSNTLADVYVITTGGIGTVKLKSAIRFNDVIEFTLSSSLCVNGPASDTNTTFFIGLAAAATPMHHNAQIATTGTTPIYAADARVPTHSVPSDPPGGL